MQHEKFVSFKFECEDNWPIGVTVDGYCTKKLSRVRTDEADSFTC